MDKILSQNEWIILSGLILIFGVIWMIRAARMKDKMEYYKGKALRYEKETIACLRETKEYFKMVAKQAAEIERLQKSISNEKKVRGYLEDEILKMDPGFEFTMST